MSITQHPRIPYAFPIAGYFVDGSMAYRAQTVGTDGSRIAFATVTADGAAAIIAAYLDTIDRTHPTYLVDADGDETDQPAHVDAAQVDEIPAGIWIALRARLADRDRCTCVGLCTHGEHVDPATYAAADRELAALRARRATK